MRAVHSGRPCRPPGVRFNASRWAWPDLPYHLRMSIGPRNLLLPCPGDSGLVSDSCSSSPAFASGFLPTIHRCIAVAFGLQFRSSRPAGDFNPTSVEPCPASGRRRDCSRRPPTPPYVRFTYTAVSVIAFVIAICASCPISAQFYLTDSVRYFQLQALLTRHLLKTS
jgi:hypothetical protein